MLEFIAAKEWTFPWTQNSCHKESETNEFSSPHLVFQDAKNVCHGILESPEVSLEVSEVMAVPHKSSSDHKIVLKPLVVGFQISITIEIS